MRYFKKNWPALLQEEVVTMAEKIVSQYNLSSSDHSDSFIQFKERYEHVYSIASAAAGPPKSTEDSEWDMSDESEGDLEKPWLAEFNRYLNTHDILPEGMTVVKWWGVCNVRFLVSSCANFFFFFFQLNYGRYPVWGSLARDCLSIMASSVSSERAFSSAGITLSKRRNRLQADIVEALQFMKCIFHQDLIFREVHTVEEEEITLDSDLCDTDSAEVPWGELLIVDDIPESDYE
jgi:hAT family protein